MNWKRFDINNLPPQYKKLLVLIKIRTSSESWDWDYFMCTYTLSEGFRLIKPLKDFDPRSISYWTIIDEDLPICPQDLTSKY